MDLYASGNNGCVVYVNHREVMPKVMRDQASKARVGLHEGDVIAVKSNDRFDINSFWLSCISSNGEYLFETSPQWSCYLPGDYNKWWDIKKAKQTKPAEAAPHFARAWELLHNDPWLSRDEPERLARLKRLGGV